MELVRQCRAYTVGKGPLFWARWGLILGNHPSWCRFLIQINKPSPRVCDAVSVVPPMESFPSCLEWFSEFYTH